jgi:hypothetical protein
MIDFESPTGEQPHRVMTIIRSKGFEEYPGGKWLQHRYKEPLTEDELGKAIRNVHSARQMLNIIFQLASEFRESQPSNDDIWDFKWVTWWDGRWGTPPDYELATGEHPWAATATTRRTTPTAHIGIPISEDGTHSTRTGTKRRSESPGGSCAA